MVTVQPYTKNNIKFVMQATNFTLFLCMTELLHKMKGGG